MSLIGPRAQRAIGLTLAAASRSLRSPRARRLQKAFMNVHVFAYRHLAGRLVGRFGPAPMLLLTVRGRKTGKLRTIPLIYIPEEPIALIASNGGNDRHPQWFLNLKHDPHATVTLGRSSRDVVARIATREERERIWPRAVELWAPYQDYQRRTEREIPIVVLDTQTSDPA